MKIVTSQGVLMMLCGLPFAFLGAWPIAAALLALGGAIAVAGQLRLRVLRGIPEDERSVEDPANDS